MPSSTKLAFLFPGQGSQSIGMLQELSQSFPIITQTYQTAADVLGYDLWKLTQEGPESLLNQTEYTQPALLAAEVALFKIWEQKNYPLPDFLAGHSLGEYTALVCSNALDFKDAISLVALRGRLMQEAVAEGEGAMAAIIGLTDVQVEEICLKTKETEVLSPANFNAIGQVVIAGESTAVDRAVSAAKEAGAKIAKRIAVSVPSHCALMKPAAEKLANVLKTISFKQPNIPILSNVDVSFLEDPEQIQSALVRQLYNPVRWVEIIQSLTQNGVTQFIECGPGNVLAGLNKRIVPDTTTVSIGSVEKLEQALQN